jgi:hypothetical protein
LNRRVEAERTATAALRHALKDWFYGTHEPYDSWLQEYSEGTGAAKDKSAAATTVPAQVNQSPEADIEALVAGSGVDDLLSE